MRVDFVTARFVELMPRDLEFGVIYVSMEYAIVIHLCCCGCGNKTVTPLSPAGWSLKFNGEEVCLAPSIGNGSFPCRSHYWIVNNRVEWLEPLPRSDIDRARRRDREAQLALQASGSETVPTQRNVSDRIARLLRRVRGAPRP